MTRERARFCGREGTVLRSRGQSYDDRGAATLLAVALTGVLLLVGVAGAVVGAVLVDHRRAQAAADLAALAGARAATTGGSAPCAQAAAVAAENGAELTGCAVSGTEVEIDVLVEGPRWWGLAADLTATARAGPA